MSPALSMIVLSQFPLLRDRRIIVRDGIAPPCGSGVIAKEKTRSATCPDVVLSQVIFRGLPKHRFGVFPAEVLQFLLASFQILDVVPVDHMLQDDVQAV